MPITVRADYDTAKALLQGKAVSGYAQITLTDDDLTTFTDEERTELVTYLQSSTDSVYQFRIMSGHGRLTEATIPALRELLNSSIARKKEQAEYEVKQKAERRERHIAELEKWLDGSHNYHFAQIPNSSNFADDGEYVPRDLVARCVAERDRRIAERDAQKAAEEQAKADKELAKLVYISQWMMGQPDQLLAEQWEAGALCREDAVALIASSVLDPFGEAWILGTCYRCEGDICSKEVDCLPREVYAAWKELKAKLPAGAEWCFVEAYCPDAHCENAHWDYGVKLTVPSGPFHFKRTVKLG